MDRRLLAALVSLPILVLVIAFINYAQPVEGPSFQVNHYQVDIQGVDDEANLRIAYVADLHMASQKDSIYLREAVQEINKLGADYVVIGGDLIEGKEEEISLLEPLLDLEDRNHTLVVLGNHDYGRGNDRLANQVTEWLETNDFTVLRNEYIIYKEKTRICFIGVDAVKSWQLPPGNIDLDKAYVNADPNCTTILLSHNPEVLLLKELGGKRTDLILAAHTHGVEAKLMPAEIKDGNGFYSIKNRKMFITSGLIRRRDLLERITDTKPEIAVIELT